MILVAKPGKPFTYTGKNTARRQAILADYEPEIEEVYVRVAETTQSDIAPPSSWTTASSVDFVRAVVNKVLSHPVRDLVDIFQSGCDR